MKILTKTGKMILENPDKPLGRMVPEKRIFAIQAVRATRYSGLGDATISYEGLSENGKWISFLKKDQSIKIRKALPVARELNWLPKPILVKVKATASSSIYKYVSKPYQL